MSVPYSSFEKTKPTTLTYLLTLRSLMNRLIQSKASRKSQHYFFHAIFNMYQNMSPHPWCYLTFLEMKVMQIKRRRNASLLAFSSSRLMCDDTSLQNEWTCWSLYKVIYSFLFDSLFDSSLANPVKYQTSLIRIVNQTGQLIISIRDK